MNYQSQINEELLNRIISAAYGDAGLTESIKIYLLAAKNKEVKKVLDEYKLTADAVKQSEQVKCPDGIIKRIESETAINNTVTSLPDILYGFIQKPLLSAAAIISVMVAFLLFNDPGPKQYTDEQILTAEKHVKQSLVFVNKIFKRTADKVENDILKQQVVKPISKGISTINNLFKGG